MAVVNAARRRQAARERRAAAAARPARQGTTAHVAPARPVTKTTDSKGRVALGGKFANRAVILERLSETEIVIKLARVIPEREAWLYEDPAGLAAVRKGLAEARAAKVAQASPDLDADARLAAEARED